MSFRFRTASIPTCHPDMGLPDECQRFIQSMFLKAKKPNGDGSPGGPNGGRGIGTDPSTWPGVSKTGKQLRKWAIKSVLPADQRAYRMHGGAGKQHVEVDVAFLAAFFRHSGMWHDLSERVTRIKAEAKTRGEAAPDLSKALEEPPVGGLLGKAMETLGVIRVAIIDNGDKLDRAGRHVDEGAASEDAGAAAGGGSDGVGMHRG